MCILNDIQDYHFIKLIYGLLQLPACQDKQLSDEIQNKLINKQIVVIIQPLDKKLIFKGQLVCLQSDGGIILHSCTEIILKEEIKAKLTGEELKQILENSQLAEINRLNMIINGENIFQIFSNYE